MVEQYRHAFTLKRREFLALVWPAFLAACGGLPATPTEPTTSSASPSPSAEPTAMNTATAAASATPPATRTPTATATEQLVQLPTYESLANDRTWIDQVQPKADLLHPIPDDVTDVIPDAELRRRNIAIINTPEVQLKLRKAALEESFFSLPNTKIDIVSDPYKILRTIVLLGPNLVVVPDDVPPALNKLAPQIRRDLQSLLNNGIFVGGYTNVTGQIVRTQERAALIEYRFIIFGAADDFFYERPSDLSIQPTWTPAQPTPDTKRPPSAYYCINGLYAGPWFIFEHELAHNRVGEDECLADQSARNNVLAQRNQFIFLTPQRAITAPKLLNQP